MHTCFIGDNQTVVETDFNHNHNLENQTSIIVQKINNSVRKKARKIYLDIRTNIYIHAAQRPLLPKMLLNSLSVTTVYTSSLYDHFFKAELRIPFLKR